MFIKYISCEKFGKFPNKFPNKIDTKLYIKVRQSSKFRNGGGMKGRKNCEIRPNMHEIIDCVQTLGCHRINLKTEN